MENESPIGFYLDKTLKKIQSVYLEAFRQHGIDLTLEQWVILERIANLGDNASQSKITELGFRNRATTSRVITGLENRGLIKRTRFEGDMKRFKLSISEDGWNLIKKVTPFNKELRAIGYQGLSENEINSLITILERLWDSYDQVEHKKNGLPEASHSQ